MIDHESERIGTNPAQGIRPNDDGTTDLVFYDTDDPMNTREDPVIERSFAVTDEQIADLGDHLADEIGHAVDHPTIALMLVDREDLYPILEEITDG